MLKPEKDVLLVETTDEVRAISSCSIWTEVRTLCAKKDRKMKIYKDKATRNGTYMGTLENESGKKMLVVT